MTTEQATTLKTTLESMFEHIAQKESIIEDQIERLRRLDQPIAATPLPTAPKLYQGTRFSEGRFSCGFRLRAHKV